MTEPTRDTMRAVAIPRFGGLDTLRLQALPIPHIDADEVLIRVHTAGVGKWDPFEREGGYAAFSGVPARFPYVLGSEGAGVIAAIGAHVRGLQVGDRVYAAGFLNPKGGFYAEYVAVCAGLVARVPEHLSLRQAGVMSGVALTALRGLDDVLRLRSGESIAVVGASGGIGHVAVQLAKRMGARVVAVASGSDGVALAGSIGADAVVDGRHGDIAAAARALAPQGLDAALLTTGGHVAGATLAALRQGGRAAYPTGVRGVARAPVGVALHVFNGDPDCDILTRLADRIARPFYVHVAGVFPLARVAEAHLALGLHHLGKLALHVP